MTMPPEATTLFEDMELSFDPSTDWLDGGVPAHPFFDQNQKIQSITSHIKSKILTYGLHGIEKLIHQSRDPIDSHLVNSLRAQSELWKAVLATQRYGGIYFFSRSDAREWRDLWSQSPEIIYLIQQVDRLLQCNDNGIKAMNYAVHSFIHDESIKLERETKLIPKDALSCRGENHIAVNVQSFSDTTEDNLSDCKPRYDFHDFAHLTTATLCSDLYGNQYHPKLTNLPLHLTALIRSRNLELLQPGREQTTLLTDGIVFSEFLTKIFTDEIESAQIEVNDESGAKVNHTTIYPTTYGQLTETLASKVAEYLMGRRTLIHNTTGEAIKLPAPIAPVQLAVLAQNKAYEMTASEIEQRVFFRGRGKDEAPLDELESCLGAWERIETLAGNRRWTYFEVRNTIKHRAHTEAYRLVAEELLGRGEDPDLCRAILDNIQYEDWKRGERVNLWDLASSSGCLL